MRHDPWLTEISFADIEAAMQRKAAREALIAQQAAEITRLRAAINDALTAPWPDPVLNSTWHQEPIGPNETPEEAIKRLVGGRAEWAVYKNNCENPVIAELRAALATARQEGMEQAAQIVKEIWEKFVKSLPNDVCINVTLDGEKIDPDGVDIPTGMTYEAAIRAAAKEGKP